MIPANLQVILVTALVSGFFTLAGAFLCIKFFIVKRFQKELDDMAETFERRLRKEFEAAGEELVPEFRKELVEGFRETAEEMLPEFRKELAAGFEETAEEMLPEFREELKQGFHEAGAALLPELRAEVREGFKDGVMDIISGELVPNAAQTVARKSTDIVSNGLNRIFGRRPKRDS